MNTQQPPLVVASLSSSDSNLVLEPRFKPRAELEAACSYGASPPVVRGGLSFVLVWRVCCAVCGRRPPRCVLRMTNRSPSSSFVDATPILLPPTHAADLLPHSFTPSPTRLPFLKTAPLTTGSPSSLLFSLFGFSPSFSETSGETWQDLSSSWFSLFSMSKDDFASLSNTCVKED